MKDEAIDKQQERLDKILRKLKRETRDVRDDVRKDELADRAAYDLAHPPLERAKEALLANDAEIERLRAEGVDEVVLEAMAVDSAQLREFIANAPTPMAPEAVAEIARRTAEINAAIFAAAKELGLETDNMVAVNAWVQADALERRDAAAMGVRLEGKSLSERLYTPEIVAMMQALGEYRNQVTPAHRQTEPKPALRRVQGPIDPATGEHTYTIEIAKGESMTRIGSGRERYMRVIADADAYRDEFAEMLGVPREGEEPEKAPPKQMRIGETS